MRLAVKKKEQVKASVDLNMNVWDASEKLYDALEQFITSYENSSKEETERLKGSYDEAFRLVRKLEQEYPQLFDDLMNEI